MAKQKQSTNLPVPVDYDRLLGTVSEMLEYARRVSVRTINRLLTATYWNVGRHIVEYEQVGSARAKYGEALLKSLARDLTAAHGRGFSE